MAGRARPSPRAAGPSGRCTGPCARATASRCRASRVELRGPGTPLLVTTGPDGAFRVGRLAAGEYEVTVDAPGLALRGASRAAVGAGETTLELVLVPAPVREHVVVTATRGEATLLDARRRHRRPRPRSASTSAPRRSCSRCCRRSRASPRPAPAAPACRRSAFIRGGESRYARVLVDGVPVNQPGGAFDFGTALPFELERVEVVRGAASSLYGSDALAGVVSLTTRRARPGESPSLRGRGRGRRRRLAPLLRRDLRHARVRSTGTRACSGSRPTTSSRTAPSSRRLRGALGRRARSTGAREARARASRRRQHGRHAGPDRLRPSRPRRLLRAARTVSDRAALRRSGARVSQQLGLAYASTRQLSLDPLDSGTYVPESERHGGRLPALRLPASPPGSRTRRRGPPPRTRRTLSLGSRQLLTAGAEAEHETGELGDRAGELLRPTRTNAGVYVQDRVLLGSRAYLTLGGRVEHNGSYGTRGVPRAALAVRLREGVDATTLRASAGLGIKEPSFLESYGESFYAQGNPHLKPERSTTFDVGVEQRLLGSRLRATATVFHHDYRDQIAYTVVDFDTFQGTYVNLAHTRSRASSSRSRRGRSSALHLLGQYTFQDGEILDSPSDFDPVYAEGEPLLRRPRHQGSLSAAYAFAARQRRRDPGERGRARRQRLRRPRPHAQPRLHAPRRAGAGACRGAARGVSRRGQPARRAVPGGARLPGARAAPCAAASGSASADGPDPVRRPALAALLASLAFASHGAGGRAPSRAYRLAEPDGGRAPRRDAPARAAGGRDALGRRPRHVERRGTGACRRGAAAAGRPRAAGRAAAATSSSSRSTPTPTFCTSSRSRACGTTA